MKNIISKSENEVIATVESNEEMTIIDAVKKSGGEIDGNLVIWGPHNAFGIAYDLNDLEIVEG